MVCIMYNCTCVLYEPINPITVESWQHRRSMETEAKANCRCCFVGENCRTHGFYSDCVADKFIKGVQGQK